MSTPQRVQRSRAAGSRMPEGAVYVGRGSRFGNPFGHARDRLRPDAVARHAAWLSGTAHADEITRGARTCSRSDVLAHVHELAGKTLACWCPVDGACHADTLQRLAARACNVNDETRETP